MVLAGYEWLWVVIGGYWMNTGCYGLLWVVMSGCGWLWVGMGGYEVVTGGFVW